MFETLGVLIAGGGAVSSERTKQSDVGKVGSDQQQSGVFARRMW